MKRDRCVGDSSAFVFHIVSYRTAHPSVLHKLLALYLSIIGVCKWFSLVFALFVCFRQLFIRLPISVYYKYAGLSKKKDKGKTFQ